jgi:hypothetical protein
VLCFAVGFRAAALHDRSTGNALKNGEVKMRHVTRTRLWLAAPLAASVFLAAGSFWIANTPAEEGAAPNSTAPARPANATVQPTATVDHPLAAIGPHDAPGTD